MIRAIGVANIRDMRMSEGVEWGIHSCMILAALPDRAALPAERLAEFHDLRPTYLAKHLQVLSRAGIIRSSSGPRGGYRLGRPPGEITLLDVVEAIEGSTDAFRCQEIRRQGPVAAGPEEYRQACVVTRAIRRAETTFRRELATTSIADLNRAVKRDTKGRATAATGRWLADVVR